MNIIHVAMRFRFHLETLAFKPQLIQYSFAVRKWLKPSALQQIKICACSLEESAFVTI